MQSKLKLLFKLQKIDSRLQELEDLRGDLPQKVDETHDQLEETTAQLKNKKEALRESELEQEKLNLDIKEAQEKFQKYKNQLYRVTSNREYDALTLEIDGVKSAVDQFEYRVLELDEKKDELQNEIKELEEQKNRLSVNYESLEQELQQKLNETNREEENLRYERQEVVSRLDRPIYSTYERVRRGKNGLAVVATRRNACGGCFNSIPPQRLLELREQNKFITCDFCGRILVWNEEPAES